MKKIISLVAIMFVALCVYAQQDEEEKKDKPTVCIEEFTNNTSYSDEYTKNLQNQVISGISATGRLKIVQPSSFAKLPKDPMAYQEALKAEGVNFILKGSVNTITLGKSTSALDKNTTYTTATISYTLTLINIESHQTDALETKEAKCTTGNSEKDAIMKAANDASEQMEKFVGSHIRLNGKIKTLDQVDPKKGAKSVYISMGSASGLAKGDILEVFAEIVVAGEKANKKIGELKANEVMSATLTLCDVKNGGLEIKKAYEEGTPMVVRTRVKKEGVGGFLKGAKSIF